MHSAARGRYLMALVVVASLGVAACASPASRPVHGHGMNGSQQNSTPYSPVTRTYYIAADEVRWNYAPDGQDDITGKPWDAVSSTYTTRGPQRIGSTYIKSLYRAYTDETFTHLAPVPQAWRHLGMLGPVIRAVVGDTVVVVFQNHLNRPASVHVHGLKYAKDAEGAPYNDGTSGAARRDDAVQPGRTFTYRYSVPQRAGPAGMDASSVMWMYHSHVSEVADDYAGLVGPIIVTAPDRARSDATPADIDREFVLQFKVSSENQSPYLRRNIQTFTTRPSTVDPDDEEFQESNQMHSINGYVYGNQPLSTMTMVAGERVRFYLMAMGTEVDLHTPHFHGNTAVVAGMRTDVVNLLPASMVVADMTPDAPGTWLLHCHVNDHITAGMLTRYRVLPR